MDLARAATPIAHRLRRQLQNLARLATLVGLALLNPIETLATDWIIGFNQEWNTAVGEIRPSKEALGIIDATKSGLFVDAEDSPLWQERVLKMMGHGLMADRGSNVLFAPGIGVPAQSMSEQQFADINRILTEAKAPKGGKPLAYISDGENQFEIWTTEGIHAFGYGGGLSRIEKTNFGWRSRSLMFDDKTNEMVSLRFWDLALSNDYIEQIEGPKGAEMLGAFVRLELERTIAPKVKTTFIAVEPTQSMRSKYTDRVLLVQKECRQFLGRRILQALNKKAKPVTGHSGFRNAKWGSSFADTSRALLPFLQHDSNQVFIASRVTSDIETLYKKHLSRDVVASPLKADRWKALLELQSHQVGTSRFDSMGIERATSHFSGHPNRLSEFVAETGIPLAPDLDYWSYDTSQGRYTAWFIDDQFYAVQIEPSPQTASLFTEVMADLSQRYGEFTDRPKKNGSGTLIHEDAHGGTLVLYISRGSKPSISRIYHYSLDQRSSVKKKMDALTAASSTPAKPAASSFAR